MLSEEEFLERVRTYGSDEDVAEEFILKLAGLNDACVERLDELVRGMIKAKHRYRQHGATVRWINDKGKDLPYIQTVESISREFTERYGIPIEIPSELRASVQMHDDVVDRVAPLVRSLLHTTHTLHGLLDGAPTNPYAAYRTLHRELTGLKETYGSLEQALGM